MSVLDLESPDLPTPTLTPVRTGRRRPAHGRGRAATPGLRPPSTPNPSTGRGDSEPARNRACRPLLGTAAESTGDRRRASTPAWRLTDRGIALVLVVAAMLAVSALAVVVPTALRVTGDNYQPVGTSHPLGASDSVGR